MSRQSAKDRKPPKEKPCKEAQTAPKKPVDSRYERLPIWCYVLLGIALLALVIYLIAALCVGFAEWFNRTVGAAMRASLAFLTSWLPFSLSEMLILSVPVLLVLLSIYAYRKRCETWKSVFVFMGCILSAFSVLFSLFVFSFGAGYHTAPLEQRLGYEAVNVDESSLYETSLWLVEELNAAADGIQYAENGFSVMPYDRKTMNAHLIAAYRPVCEAYPFVQRMNSRVKPVLVSRLMSYTHITGVYTYFTGEANINVDFPDYTLPYTAAHELAHQRGIARENEANFVAFLVTAASSDAYVRYSGYLNLFEYVSTALYYENAERYKEVVGLLDPRVLEELRAFSDFFDTYRNAAIAELSGAVNDAHIKLNGDKAGIDSYGLVVDLAVAYYARYEKTA